jgi:hypothetical protein
MSGTGGGGERVRQAWRAASLCNSSKVSASSLVFLRKTPYPTDDHGAALTLSHHVARTLSNAATGHPRRRRQAEVHVPQLRAERVGSWDVILLITAVQRMLDELIAVIE